jgi:hypothetical protein
MSDFTDETLEEIKRAEPLFLGVIGSRTDATEERIRDEVLLPILQELGRMPDKMLLPEEGTTSIYISDWADTMKVPSQVYQCDWQRHGKRAKIFRDSRIQEESTHFIIFLQKRSEFNEKLATRLARKGYKVFTVAYNDWSIEELTLTDPPGTEPYQSNQKIPPSSQPAAPAKRGRKPGIGRAQASHQSPPSEGPGSQPQLTDLWEA